MMGSNPTGPGNGGLERLFGSVVRLRILRQLAENSRGDEALSLYRLEVLTGVGGADLKGHVNQLVESGLVKEFKLGNNRKYALDRRSPIVVALINLIETIEGKRPKQTARIIY